MASTAEGPMTVEKCWVAPPSDILTDTSLALTCFDSLWLHFPPVHCLLFYKFTCSDHETLISNLKHSLSLALKYFYPLAGHLILYPSTTPLEPKIRYLNGDAVQLTIAKCNSDFDYFVEKNRQYVSELFPLIPHLPPVAKLSEYIRLPLLALQVTIFPNNGVCIGFTNSHVIADGNTMMNFRKAWASINKHGSEEPFLASGTLPFYERSLIPDPKVLSQIFKSQIEKFLGLEDFQVPEYNFPTIRDIVQASFLIRQSDIQTLKRKVVAEYSNLGHVSSFVVTCAYIWSCFVKSRIETCADDRDHFIFAVDCRTRVDPPIPNSYFGNCLGACFASVQSIRLLGKDGFTGGAKAIGESINNFFHSDGGVLKDAEMWLLKLFEEAYSERILSVSGSPKFKIYNIDFGWGKPEKVVHGLKMGTISLDASKDSEGGLEVGLSLPENRMNVFAAIFADGLRA